MIVLIILYWSTNEKLNIQPADLKTIFLILFKTKAIFISYNEFDIVFKA